MSTSRSRRSVRASRVSRGKFVRGAGNHRVVVESAVFGTLVDRLDNHGLISKTIDPENRRRRQVQLTEAGRERCALAYDQAAATERWIAGALGDAGAEQLRALLRTLADAQPPT
ncbi:MarR family winged helix-turn-helix transcriptional regulator [Nocardia colli]|uniref:MarR family winged helix-turn-helix transcriptional regulator n=1 Tax=Nocardia colli TaxID=2545717 RepID=UPI0035D656DC